ncbi:orotidine-5'-phosphate decarboxylase [Persephonella sp.]
MSEKKLAVALDVSNMDDVEEVLTDIGDQKVIIKIGYRLFIKYGLSVVEKIKSYSYEVFLDLKLHDIPNTVYNGVLSAVDIGVDYLTIHTLGGVEMLEKAVDAKSGSNLKLLGVTILTSHSNDYLKYIGTKYSLEDLVFNLAKTAVNIGVDGIVCSAEEVEKLKADIGRDFTAVVPGIRFPEDEKSDQKRVATPEVALKSGADILVVGRPIINSKNRSEAVKKFLDELKRC